MKKIIALLLSLAIVITGLPFIFVSAEESVVTVTADESWQEATYDPATGYLKNVTDDYYFAVTFDSAKKTFALKGIANNCITAPKVVIPSKITYSGTEYSLASIGSYTLTGGKAVSTVYGVQEVIISEGITTVTGNSFRSVKGLAKVHLPSTIKEIGTNAFASSSIAEMNFPEGLEILGSGALQANSFESITLPSTIKSFGGSMFYGCSKLSNVEFLFDYTTIPGSTFRGCKALKTFVIKDDITAIGSFAFSQTGYKELIIPKGVTVIEKQTFSVSTGLASITFKGEVTSIDGQALYNCTGLKTINFEGKNAPTLASNSLQGVKGATLVVNYPADGAGYDSEDFQALFPAGTTFVRAEGEPSVKDFSLHGLNIIETTLTTSYTFIDPMDREESGSVAVWEGCEEADFTSSEVFLLKTQECTSANPPSYFIQETDDGKYIRVTITPKNADDKLNTGKPVSVQLTQKVRLPQTIPTVSLIAPSDGYMVNCNKPVNLSASAVCDNTTITKVEFYANDVVVAEVTEAPYDATWTPTEMGDYTIYAKAYNAIGEDQSSDSVSISVLSEDADVSSYITIEFTSPIADSMVLTGDTVTFTGTAVESSGSEIKNVDIYDNGKLIHSAASEIISFSHKFETGTHTITATAKSVDGKTGFSKPFDITVSGMLFPNMISDNMVLQRNKPVKLTGYGADGVVVTAEIIGNSASAVVSNGMWQITLPAMPTTKSTTLTFSASDGTSKTFNNVAVGEVLLISGQSNVTMVIGNNYKFASDNPCDGIRIFKTGSGSASTPQTDTSSGTWNVSAKDLIKTFTGVGYLTGYYYYLSQNGEVPVGLIQSAVSGTGISLWVPNDAFDYDLDLKKIDKSTTHYNHMIAPWTGYTIGTVLWYQGESDSQHSRLYEKSLTAYIQSYREKFEDESINFIITELPVFDAVVGYNSAFRSFWMVREGQYNVSKHLDNVETIITVDTGSIKTVHPGGKDVIGARAALILQHFANPEQDIIWKSPNYAYNEIADGKMIIHFNDVGEGLKTTDGLAPKAFKAAGDDMIFTDVEATLVGNTIEIDVSGIVGTPHVRYACEDVPGRTGDTWSVNLVNSANLPMAPFRTDDAKIQFQSYDAETGIYSNPYNFAPMIKGITASSITDGKAVITVDARGFDDKIASVELFIDGVSVGMTTQSDANTDHWIYEWTDAKEGSHTFHAVAIDEFGLSSNASSVTPRKYSIVLANGVSAEEITLNYNTNGDAVAATVLDGSLIIAAYNDKNELVGMKYSTNKTARLDASSITDAVVIKAFVFDDMINIEPISKTVTLGK